MSLDPPLQQLVNTAARGVAPTNLAERRRLADATMLLASTGPEDDVTITEHEVAVAGGVIRARVTTPNGGSRGTLFFIHGGGWFQGNLDTAEIECGPLASSVPCTVVSVDYRLAPEHPFPTPLDDCVAAYEWMYRNAALLGIDTDRVAIGGCSAGGNLAVALCLTARDRGLPMPCFQLLDAPCLDLTLSSPSMDEHGVQWGLTKAGVDEFVGMYVGAAARIHPRVSPLLEDDLRGLPPALVIVAELDPVRDDGERYVERLHEAGVEAAGLRVLGHFHGGWIIPLTLTFGLVRDLRADALRRALGAVVVVER